jgi:hypothetical protein
MRKTASKAKLNCAITVYLIHSKLKYNTPRPEVGVCHIAAIAHQILAEDLPRKLLWAKLDDAVKGPVGIREVNVNPIGCVRDGDILINHASHYKLLSGRTGYWRRGRRDSQAGEDVGTLRGIKGTAAGDCSCIGSPICDSRVKAGIPYVPPGTGSIVNQLALSKANLLPTDNQIAGVIHSCASLNKMRVGCHHGRHTQCKKQEEGQKDRCASFGFHVLFSYSKSERVNQRQGCAMKSFCQLAFEAKQDELGLLATLF